MYPRLQMMRAMLKPTGVLAICIDYRELFRLGQMLDELFGEKTGSRSSTGRRRRRSRTTITTSPRRLSTFSSTPRTRGVPEPVPSTEPRRRTHVTPTQITIGEGRGGRARWSLAPGWRRMTTPFSHLSPASSTTRKAKACGATRSSTLRPGWKSGVRSTLSVSSAMIMHRR